MKENQFRAWDKKEEKMITVVSLQNRGEFIQCYDGNKGLFTLNIPDQAELMRATGLKDKTGRSIYERDIIETDTYDGELFFRKILWVVFWNKEYACFDLHSVNHSQLYIHPRVIFSQGECVGNIHENPELLREKNVL